MFIYHFKTFHCQWT